MYSTIQDNLDIHFGALHIFSDFEFTDFLHVDVMLCEQVFSKAWHSSKSDAWSWWQTTVSPVQPNCTGE